MAEQFIHKLRVELPAGLAADQRRHWSQQAVQAIKQAELVPRGFPPHAVLVVRRLIAPAPAELWAGQPWQAGSRWGAAARPALEACWRTAVRPAQTGVPADALAVWFADMAEWLACFSRDLARGDATQRWWWARWLGQAPTRPAPTVGVWWRAEARWLPGAIAWLQRHAPAELPAITRSLAAAECRAIVLALAAAYTCSPPASDPLPLAIRQQSLATPTLDNLRPAERVLIELGLALFYAPGATRAWLAASASTPPRRVPESGQPARMIATAASPPAALPPTASATVLSNSACTSAPPAATESHDAEQAFPDNSDQKGEARTLPPAAPTAGVATRSSTPSPSTQSPSMPSPSTPIDNRPTPRLERLDEMRGATPAQTLDGTLGIATSLGGIWYLVNLLIALAWLDAAGQISPWMLLGALAEELLREQPTDPVWNVLVVLAAPVEPLDDEWPAAQQWVALHFDECIEWLVRRNVDLTMLVACLATPATLYVTHTHIDLVFRLDQIDLNLRQAGLDQNPGWVPDLARIVTFHFE